MVDPHDSKTMQLPFPLRRARVDFLRFLDYREFLGGYVEERISRIGALRLAMLGGLMGAW